MVLAACGGSSEDPADDPADEGGTERSGALIFGQETAFPENLFPLIATGNSVATANMLIRTLPAPFLTQPDFTFGVDPNLNAEDPAIEETDGGQVVTYTLNPDAVWSDGTQMTVDDFEFTWRIQRSSDPADGGCEALISTVGYDQIESVEAGDDEGSVVVTYSSPFPDWKSLFTLLPAHIMDTGDDASNCEMVTTGWPVAEGLPDDFSGGPWQLLAENIDAGQQVVTYVPNEMWWGEGPLLENLIIQTIGSEANTTVAGMSSGDLQLVQPQPQLDLIGQLDGLAPNVTSEITFGLSFEHFDMNFGNVHLAKPEVRQAFGLALDRAEIVGATVGAFDDRAQVLNNRFYVNNQPEYVDTAPEQYNAQDTAGAIALLEEAGYTIGANGVAVHPEDGPLQMRMSTTQNNPLRESTIDLASAQVAKAGFAIEKFLDPDIFAGNLEEGNYDIALFAWVSSPYVSGNASIYETGGGQNWTGGSSAEADELLAQLATEVDPTAAAQLANDADAALWEDLSTIPLYQKPIVTAWSSDFEGIVPNATNAGPVWNSDQFALAQ